jgi:hypothetical protein
MPKVKDTVGKTTVKGNNKTLLGQPKVKKTKLGKQNVKETLLGKQNVQGHCYENHRLRKAYIVHKNIQSKKKTVLGKLKLKITLLGKPKVKETLVGSHR